MSFGHYRFWIVVFVGGLMAGAGLASPTCAQEDASSPPVVFREGLAVRQEGGYARSAVYSDALAYQLATGAFEPPEVGAPLRGASPADAGPRWHPITAGDEGYFESDSLRGGYLYVSVEAEEAQTMILEASGHSMAFVNGAPRAGDVYDYGWIRQPVALEAGRNDFLFRSSRGRVRARLVEPQGEATLTTSDLTLPDLIRGEARPVWGAIRVTNTRDEPLSGLQLHARTGTTTTTTPIPTLPAQATRKVGFEMSARAAPDTGRTAPVALRLQSRRTGARLDTARFDVGVRDPGETHRRTFLSDIDGSVQYYSVVPADSSTGGAAPAMFLSLHGASVESISQARAYAPKAWGHIVAPTNRRPYGFDWEDWGRLNAMQTLRVAEERLGTDPKRTYLTGHSMGGHGTWQVGATYPGRFAAIAPIAGWYSFWSYTGERDQEGGDPTPVEKALRRASNPSNTLGLSRNYLHHGVYILHGEDDRTVPVGQARHMREHLAGYHPDFAYYEYPDAGHWWGRESVDFAPLFDYFRWHEVPDDRDVLEVEFVTANPGISARTRWLGLEAQQHPLALSKATIVQDTARSRFSGTTKNVARLSLAFDQLPHRDTVTVALDGDTLAPVVPAPGQERLYLSRAADSDSTWHVTERPDSSLKGPHRYGTFKDAFRHRVALVYSTAGTAAENDWSYQKARFDAETFWYRGNGSPDVVADTAFDVRAAPDRNVVLYGNASTNAVWDDLLGSSPVQVERGAMRVGERMLQGADLGTYFVRPRPGSAIATVGAVSGTGLEGLRAANANQYFRSGAGFPDVFVFRAGLLQPGSDGGVEAWGYFGNDWRVESGDLLWPSP